MGYQTARLRYRTAPLVVAHAHGFVVQTLADLGLVGLARGARAARLLDGRGGARHAPVQPPLDALERVARPPLPATGTGARLAAARGRLQRRSASAC